MFLCRTVQLAGIPNTLIILATRLEEEVIELEINVFYVSDLVSIVL
jgi:hypothetical protein